MRVGGDQTPDRLEDPDGVQRYGAPARPHPCVRCELLVGPDSVHVEHVEHVERGPAGLDRGGVHALAADGLPGVRRRGRGPGAASPCAARRAPDRPGDDPAASVHLALSRCRVPGRGVRRAAPTPGPSARVVDLQGGDLGHRPTATRARATIEGLGRQLGTTWKMLWRAVRPWLVLPRPTCRRCVPEIDHLEVRRQEARALSRRCKADLASTIRPIEIRLHVGTSVALIRGGSRRLPQAPAREVQVVSLMPRCCSRRTKGSPERRSNSPSTIEGISLEDWALIRRLVAERMPQRQVGKELGIPPATVAVQSRGLRSPSVGGHSPSMSTALTGAKWGTKGDARHIPCFRR